jgi:hypothetical protein
MGGSGGAGRYRLSESDINRLREEAQERLERNRRDAEVNQYLEEELAEINDRDSERVKQRLDEIERALRREIEAFDRILFGGSVAKHTYVDGLSDTDSLVVLDQNVVGELRPEQMRELFRDILRRRLNMGAVGSIEVGRMAVTVTYRDGTKIQLLPAVQKGESVAISSANGTEWTWINPKEFSARLTRINEYQAGGVVPAIKIAKAIIANQLPETSRPTGYHVEALAVSAFQGYGGPRTPKAMVEHFFGSASDGVLRPIPDVTGQSPYVDSSLGASDSAERQRLSRRLQQIARRVRTSTSVADWKDLLGQ